MNAAPQTLQPNAYERAYDKLTDALMAIDRGLYRDAAAFTREAYTIFQTEDQFREARKGRAT